jgi:hypothetical protein
MAPLMRHVCFLGVLDEFPEVAHINYYITLAKCPCVATGNQNVYIAIYIGFNKIVTI